MSLLTIPVRLLDVPAHSVQDSRGRSLTDLRMSVLDRCNFRCPYCMPADRFPAGYRFLDAAARMSMREMHQMIDSFVTIGIRKLRLTGGEPLLYRDLVPLIRGVRECWPSLEIALTTNGTRLPVLAAALREAGLSRVTVSLDALDADRFALLSGGHGNVQAVLRGVDAAQAAGFIVKINCVVIRDQNLQEVLPLVRHFRNSGCVLRFIEYMDVGTVNGWSAASVVSAGELIQMIGAEFPLQQLARVGDSDVAQRCCLQDGSLELGFITSVSDPFCGSCSRARLSADGHLYTCLFSDHGHDLLTVLRRDGADAVTTTIQRTWQRRDDRYSELRGLEPSSPIKAEMYHLGG